MPTLKHITNYVETHHKTPANSAQPTIQKQEQPPKRSQKSPAFTAKNFPALNVLALIHSL